MAMLLMLLSLGVLFISLLNKLFLLLAFLFRVSQFLLWRFVFHIERSIMLLNADALI